RRAARNEEQLLDDHRHPRREVRLGQVALAAAPRDARHRQPAVLPPAQFAARVQGHRSNGRSAAQPGELRDPQLRTESTLGIEPDGGAGSLRLRRIEESAPAMKGADDVLVSVGVPVYNGAAELRRALDTLVAQTHRNLEIVISDNASTDATPEICREFAKRDP